ncbi:MAG TPA: hypothetical protein VIN61_04380 [Gammaproteobacteria bacterium]
MHGITPITRAALLSGIAATLLAAAAHAQINDSIRGRPSEANHFIETPRGWKHPMTPWGEPDIRANLNMMQAAGVPLERCANSYRPGAPPCDMNKVWLTEEEYQERWAALERPDRYQQAISQGDFGAAIQAAVTDPAIPQRQTNLIVDPPNGLLPPLTEEGKRRARLMGSDWALPGEDIVFDSLNDFDSWDRCITRGMPSMMMPYRYNGGFRILQAPGYVIFDIEMIHEARIIPTDGRPPLPSQIKQWLGESRGHWEGNTLVVETTNYKVGPPMINLAVVGSPPGNRFPISEQMKTTERIVRLNDEWWLYEITTEDPVILTRPFTVRYPMRHDPNYWWSEYACHEDNTIVRNYVTTNRYELANPTPEPPQPPVQVSPEVADALAGRWVGRPRIVTIDVDIELEFTKNPDGTVNGKLIGTNLGKIDKPLRDFKIEGRHISFQLPNIQPWNIDGNLTQDGKISAVVFSIQGGAPVTFERVSGS